MLDMKDIMNTDCANNEKCVPFETPIKPTSLARAYVPYQKICGYYEPLEALINGTIFPSLNK